MTKKKIIILASSITIAILLIIGLILSFWLAAVPNIVKNSKAQNFIKNEVKKSLNMDLIIKNPNLKTFVRPKINFEIENLILTKDNETIVELKDFETSVSFGKILKKQIKLNRLFAKKLTLKADKLLEALPKEQEQNAQFDYKIDFYKASIGLKYLNISYFQNKNLLEILANDIFINERESHKTLDFESIIKVKNENKDYITVKADAKDKIKVFDDKITVEDFDILVNNSKIKIAASCDIKNIKINAKSDKFYLKDVFDIINSNFIIPDGRILLAPLIKPNGNVAFDVNSINNELDGIINLNNTKASLKDLTNIPLNINKGKIIISKDKIDFIGLEGFWGKNKKNGIKIYGDIKDYYKSFDSNLTIDTVITNEFFHNYLQKLINVKLFVSKPSGTRILYKAKNGIMDVTWLAKISKGVNFGIDENKSALSDYDRAVKGDFHIEGDKIEIRNINYYIASSIEKGMHIKPIIVISGLTDFQGKLYKAGFSFGREMPSEFLNIFVGSNTFKKGTIKGDLHFEFKDDVPYLDSNMELKDTFIPSQRLKISSASIHTTQNNIHLNSTGRFKKANYKFDGDIKNGLIAPYIIKNLKLEVDEIDVERFLASMNNQQVQTQAKDDDADDDTDDFMFDTNLLRIEDCDFILHKGHYKEIEFGNLKADLTLDDKGILNIKSNRFDFAKGISGLKVVCDLKNLKYNVILGAKDIDSNLMAKVLFNLDKEITGLASGIINLNTDSSMKLNGELKFTVNDGTIGKIGLVEYVLKIASLFRNPIVMVNPTTIMDIVSIPEGKFDKIKGTIVIKENVVHNIFIQSYSDTLSALIRGRFDMERHDASLRIYTRFSTDKKSMFGFLRNISLNALANKVQMNNRNDANYYASELVDLPAINLPDERTQVFLTRVEGDVENNNFLSSLRKIK